MTSSTSVFLNVDDIQRSLAFYRGLGYHVLAEHEDDRGRVRWADLALDGADLGLGEISSNDDPEFRAWTSTPLGAGVVVYVSVPRLDPVWKRAQATRAVVEHPPVERSYGRVFTINDPDGYTLAFLEEPRPQAARRAKTAKPKPGRAARATAKRPAKKTKKAKARRGRPAARTAKARKDRRR